QEAVIEVDDTADEFRREDAHAAVVQEIDAGGSAGHIEHGVIAEMRIAVDHAEAAERPPPGREHRGAEPVAGGEVSLGVFEQPAPIEPLEGEEPAARELRPYSRHADLLDAVEHLAREHDVLGFAPVIELLANAR